MEKYKLLSRLLQDWKGSYFILNWEVVNYMNTKGSVQTFHTTFSNKMLKFVSWSFVCFFPGWTCASPSEARNWYSSWWFASYLKRNDRNPFLRGPNKGIFHVHLYFVVNTWLVSLKIQEIHLSSRCILVLDLSSTQLQLSF